MMYPSHLHVYEMAVSKLAKLNIVSAYAAYAEGFTRTRSCSKFQMPALREGFCQPCWFQTSLDEKCGLSTQLKEQHASADLSSALLLTEGCRAAGG